MSKLVCAIELKEWLGTVGVCDKSGIFKCHVFFLVGDSDWCTAVRACQ